MPQSSPPRPPLPSIVNPGHPARAVELTGRGALGDASASSGGPRVFELRGWAKMTHPQRVRTLRTIAEEYGRDPDMAAFTVQVLRGAGVMPRDWPRIAATLLRYVQDHVYYVNEPDERIQSPWRTLSSGTGDCDDASVLLASMATSIALPNRFMLVGRLRSAEGSRMVRWVEGTPMPRNWANGKAVEWLHIAVVLGWPFGAPLSRQWWAEAEPTMQGAPLGYSIVRHGVDADPHGRLGVPVATRTDLEPYRGLPPNGGGVGAKEGRMRRKSGRGGGAFYGSVGAVGGLGSAGIAGALGPSTLGSARNGGPALGAVPRGLPGATINPRALDGALGGVPVPGMALSPYASGADVDNAAKDEKPWWRKIGMSAAEAGVGAVAAFIAVGIAERYVRGRRRRRRGFRR